MSVRCPQCCSTSSLTERDIGPAGRMLRCEVCGTRWLARNFADDPFGTEGFARLARSRAGEAVVVEHIGPGFRRSEPGEDLPPIRALPHLDPTLMRRLAVIAAVFVAALALRAPLVAALPNLPGALSREAASLEFIAVRSQTLDAHGGSTLVVEGTLVNNSAADVALPAIRVTLRASNGDPVKSWLVEPTVAGLAPGRSIGFRSAVASPPQEATEVTLDLAGRQGT